MKGWFKGWWFRFKIFIWYLVTEPFRQMKEIVLSIVHILDNLNNTMVWAYVILLLAIVFHVKGERYAASVFISLLLFVFLLWEWNKGTFMKRFRDKERKRINKQEVIEHGRW